MTKLCSLGFVNFTTDQLSNPNYTQEYKTIVASVTKKTPHLIEVYVKKRCGEVEKIDL